MEQLFLHLLLGGANFTKLRRGAVGDIEAARARAIGVEDSQRLLGGVEREATEGHLLVHLLEQGQDALQAAQKALHLEKLHMVGDLPCRAATEGIADILHLTQEDHRLIHGGFQFLSVADEAFHIVEFLLQCLALLRGVELQAANPLDAEGRTAVKGLQNILQADFDFIIKGNVDHTISSLTLMTGASMASFILAMNTSLSKCQP